MLCSMWPQVCWLSFNKSIRNSCLHLVGFVFPDQLDPRFSVEISTDAKWAGTEETVHTQPRTLQLVRSAQESGWQECSISALHKHSCYAPTPVKGGHNDILWRKYFQQTEKLIDGNIKFSCNKSFIFFQSLFLTSIGITELPIHRRFGL